MTVVPGLACAFQRQRNKNAAGNDGDMNAKLAPAMNRLVRCVDFHTRSVPGASTLLCTMLIKLSRVAAFALVATTLSPSLLYAQDDAGRRPALGSPHVYKKVDGHDLHVSIASPNAKEFPGMRPILITIHGGGFVGGNASSLNPQAEYFLKRGMVSAEVEYRLIGKGAKDLEDEVRDVRSAVRWVKAHAAEFHGDPDKVVLMGGSAGGYLVEANILLAGPDDADADTKISTMPVAAVLFNPVLNGEPGAKFHRVMQDTWKDMSPYSRVTREQPPTITLIGGNDTTVGVPDTVEFSKRLRAVGVRSELYIYPGQVHGFFNHDPYVTATLIPIDQFLTSLGLIAPATLPPSPLSAEQAPAITR